MKKHQRTEAQNTRGGRRVRLIFIEQYMLGRVQNGYLWLGYLGGGGGNRLHNPGITPLVLTVSSPILRSLHGGMNGHRTWRHENYKNLYESTALDMQVFVEAKARIVWLERFPLMER